MEEAIRILHDSGNSQSQRVTEALAYALLWELRNQVRIHIGVRGRDILEYIGDVGMYFDRRGFGRNRESDIQSDGDGGTNLYVLLRGLEIGGADGYVIGIRRHSRELSGSRRVRGRALFI